MTFYTFCSMPLIQPFELAPSQLSISYHSHFLSFSPSLVSSSHTSQACSHLRTFSLASPLPGTLFPQNFSLCSYSLSPFIMYQFPSIQLSVHDILLYSICLFVYHQSSSLEYKIHEANNFDLCNHHWIPKL